MIINDCYLKLSNTKLATRCFQQELLHVNKFRYIYNNIGMEIHVTQDTIGENGLLKFETISQKRILPQFLLYNSRKQFLVYA